MPPRKASGSGFPLQVRARRSSSLSGFPLQSVTRACGSPMEIIGPPIGGVVPDVLGDAFVCPIPPDDVVPIIPLPHACSTGQHAIAIRDARHRRFVRCHDLPQCATRDARRFVRVGPGRVMTRPCIRPGRRCRGRQPCTYHHDTMHVVRHRHECIAYHHGHVLGYRIPTPLYDVAHGRIPHHAIRDLSECVRALMCANGDVIRTGTGVIISRQPDGSAMEPFGHDIPNIGNTDGTDRRAVASVLRAFGEGHL